GGLGGVFRTVVSPTPHWSEYGEGLPNVLVTSLHYIAQGDTLLAGTYGRSNWSISSASNTIGVAGVLEIFGDNFLDDTIRLVRQANNPSLLDVFQSNLNNSGVAPIKTVQLSTIQQINVFGLAGNDTLIVDSSNGLINVANGTRYDGGTGRDGMQLVQTDGPTQTSDTYSVGPVIGSGISRIVGPGGTQTVFFENLSPVLDLVPSALLTVNATAADNAINYGGFGFFGGQVTIDEQEAIAFANKTQLK